MRQDRQHGHRNRRREGDPPSLAANPSRAMELLGWEPKFSDLDQIIRDALKWEG